MPVAGLRAAGHGFGSGTRALPPSALPFLAAVPGWGVWSAAVEAGPVDLDGESPGDQLRRPVEVPGSDLDVDPHRVELADDRELREVGAAARGRRADEVAELDLNQADPAVDRRRHPAVAQVE